MARFLDFSLNSASVERGNAPRTGDWRDSQESEKLDSHQRRPAASHVAYRMKENGGRKMARPWRRRAFLGASVAAMASTIPTPRLTSGAEIVRKSFTYKIVGDCAIKADVFNTSPGEKRPVAVWIHGGALIMGDRRGIDKRLLDALVDAGYVVVSIDYRLAPETKLPSILDDLRDAFAWVRAEAERLDYPQPLFQRAVDCRESRQKTLIFSLCRRTGKTQFGDRVADRWAQSPRFIAFAT